MKSRTTTASWRGWPFSSTTLPRTAPVDWASAAGPASSRAAATRPAAASRRFVMDFALQGRPFRRPEILSSVSRRPAAAVGEGVGDPRLREAPEPQAAGLTRAAGLGLRLITRPGLVERRLPDGARPDDLGLGQRNH